MLERIAGELGRAGHSSQQCRRDVPPANWRASKTAQLENNAPRTNVDGLIHVTRACIGPMQQRGWGRIVNLTSIAAHGTSLAGTTFLRSHQSGSGEF